MKKISLSIAVITCISLSLLSSCRFTCINGSGKRVSEQRKVNDFKKIDISGDFKIHLQQDSSQTITISGDDNLLKYISTSVEGDRLIIKNKKRTCEADSIVVNIGVRNLVEIKSSGASSIQSAGKLNAGDLKIDFSGASKAKLDINAANFSVHSRGVIKLDITGQAASARIETNGVNKIDAFGFVVGEYTINTAAVSKCYINVLKTLNVHSAGASEIEYKGSPSTINNDKAGSSKIKKVD